MKAEFKQLRRMSMAGGDSSDCLAYSQSSNGVRTAATEEGGYKRGRLVTHRGIDQD